MVPGEGMPISKNQTMKGDLVIRFEIIFPEMLNPEKKMLIKEALLY